MRFLRNERSTPRRGRRAGFPVGALAFAVALAGCLSLAPGAEPAEDAPAAAGDRPAWAVGDWWRYQFTSDVYAKDVEVTVVVGEAREDGYLLGMPADAYALDAILFHLPPLGLVTRDLAWDVHGTVFEPFRWPLADGATWTSTWIASEVQIEAHATERGFHFTNEGREEAAFGRVFSFEYATDAEWFASYSRTDVDGRLRESFTLLEHGAGWTGTLRLLDGITVVAIDSRSTAALAGETPAPPISAFDPADDLDTLLVACVYGGAPGVYAARIARPDATLACEASGTIPPGDDLSRAVASEVPNVAGAWRMDLAAGGQGSATAEALGYRAIEVDLR